MRVEQSVPALVSYRCPDAPRCDFPGLSIQRSGDHDGPYSVLSEPRESQHPIGQILILWRDLEPLFDEAVDTGRLGRAGIKTDIAKLVTTHIVDLAGSEVRSLLSRIGAERRHFLSFPFFSSSFLFTNSSSSSALIFLSSTVRNARANVGSSNAARFISSIGGRTS